MEILDIVRRSYYPVVAGSTGGTRQYPVVTGFRGTVTKRDVMPIHGDVTACHAYCYPSAPSSFVVRSKYKCNVES
eukprot:191255-Amorphochlora_amoeboformis.AAC.1